MMEINRWLYALFCGTFGAAIISFFYSFLLWVLALPVTISLYTIFFSETVKFTSFMQICLVVLGFLSFFYMWWSCVIGLKEDKSSEEIFASSTGIFMVVVGLSALVLICALCLIVAALFWILLIAVSIVFEAMLGFDISDYVLSLWMFLLIWGVLVLFVLVFLYEVFFGEIYLSRSSVVEKSKNTIDSTNHVLLHMALGAGLFYFFTRDKNKGDK